MTWRNKLEIGLQVPMARDDRDEALDSDAPRGASRSPSGATETDAEAVATNEGMSTREPPPP